MYAESDAVWLAVLTTQDDDDVFYLFLQKQKLIDRNDTQARWFWNHCGFNPGFGPDFVRLYWMLCLLLQYLIQSCARGWRRIVEDMCYEI
jgi:hypothetical protein